MKKIEEIELLRAVAILFTLFQHLGKLLMPSKDAWDYVIFNNPYWGGVDLFFCISGFVISKSMMAHWHNLSTRDHWMEIWRFWARRFFRIVPTLWLWVGLSVTAAVYFNKSGAFGPIGPNVDDALAALLNYSNLHVYHCVIGHASCGPNPVYWSLSLEEQFYLILPLMFFLPRRIMLSFMAIIIVIQLPIHRMPWEQTTGGALWFMRTDAILIGVLIAYFSTTDSYQCLAEKLYQKYRFRTAVGLVLIISLSAVPRSGFYFTAGAIAVISGLLVLLASFNTGLLFKKSKIARPFLWIGSRSFSIYLIHLPTYYIVNELAYRLSGFDNKYKTPLTYDSFNLTIALSTFAALIVLAEANYRLIETPMRIWGRRFGEQKVKLTNSFRKPNANAP
jgi:peptidoglycan/LPS O-acetylase OafA/YrhL